jgi:hypothetical protein
LTKKRRNSPVRVSAAGGKGRPGQKIAALKALDPFLATQGTVSPKARDQPNDPVMSGKLSVCVSGV